jgi:O-antigen biosynthesis protein
LPVYNPELAHLQAAIASVRSQLYPNWELCIADDASTDPKVAPLLQETAANDPRCKVILRDENGHIAACSNSALTLATGEWVALLDQDDLLAEHALAFAAATILRHPDAGLIYSDEDKIDETGARTDPYFKSDWNPALFVVQNFVSHLGLYRRELLQEIGGFRKGFDGSQDYDLALRVSEHLRADQIVHIPRVLYHWRKIAGSLAATSEAKTYAHDSARQAICEHFQRRQIKAEVVPCPENSAAHRVIYELPAQPPLVSIIIPTRDHPELLRQCIDGIRSRTNYPRFNFVIVDNDSKLTETKVLFDELRKANDVTVIEEKSAFNFSHLINIGAAVADGDVLGLLNDDVVPENVEWLREMVSQLLQPAVGGVGARLWYPDGRLQHAGVIVGLGGVAGHAHYRWPHGHPGYFNRAILQQNFSAVTAACMLVRKTIFEQLGGFDERDLGVSFNDIDFCLRMTQQDLHIVWTPQACLVHHESASRGREFDQEQKWVFRREAGWMQEKWASKLSRDPYYNPNLSLDEEGGFALAWPPRLPTLGPSLNAVTDET